MYLGPMAVSDFLCLEERGGTKSPLVPKASWGGSDTPHPMSFPPLPICCGVGGAGRSGVAEEVLREVAGEIERGAVG